MNIYNHNISVHTYISTTPLGKSTTNKNSLFYQTHDCEYLLSEKQEISRHRGTEYHRKNGFWNLFNKENCYCGHIKCYNSIGEETILEGHIPSHCITTMKKMAAGRRKLAPFHGCSLRQVILLEINNTSGWLWQRQCSTWISHEQEHWNVQSKPFGFVILHGT